MEHITSHSRRRSDRGLKIATVNRELQVLRRMFVLAMEWGKVERVLPRVRMIPGETRRDRVITTDEGKDISRQRNRSAQRCSRRISAR
jgi:hypothetical protein